MSVRRAEGNAGRQGKRHRGETPPGQPVLQQVNPYDDRLLEYLKASIGPPAFGRPLGAHPFQPVMLRPGSRKFRGVPLPDYLEDFSTKLDGYIYMGIAMQPSKADSSLHSALGMVCIPTVVSGLADMYVGRDFTKKPGEGVFWPNDNDGVRVGTVVQIVSNPSIEGMQPMIRIKVENVGMAVRKSP